MRNPTWGALLGVLLAATTAAAAVHTVAPGQSIATALGSAAAGDSVLVAAGTYAENVSLVDGVELLGGWDATFTARDPDANPTTIHGGGAGPAVHAGPGIGSTTLVDGFILTGGGGAPGAGVLVNGGSPVFRDNEISDNRRAGIAGGAYVINGSSASFEGNLFAQNSSHGSGGGLRVEKSTPRIVGNTFDGCVAPNAGGGLYVFRSAVVCSANTFRNCRSGNSGGGGAYFQDVRTGASAMCDNVFEDCDASQGGGIMIRDDSIVTLTDNTFRRCNARAGADSSGFGGGVAVTNFSDVVLTDNEFDDCHADYKGGGLFARQSALSVLGTDATVPGSGARFSDCSADSGGAVYVFDILDGVCSRVRVSNCTADFGGGLFFHTSRFLISENIIEGCMAEDGGGVVFYAPTSQQPVSDFFNNTVYGCATFSSAGNPGGGILHQALGFQSRIATIAGNIVAGITAGSCIRCRGVGGQASRPIIHCSSFETAAGNPADVIGNPQCQGAVAVGLNNFASDDGYPGPDFCMPSFQLQDNGQPDLDSNCSFALPSHRHRGAAVMPCPALVTSLREESWGEIKARYRFDGATRR